ncbi:MAG TPA: DPP IV N-terminal domain-containing protein, partial [Chitinophagaceae bacterium]|nr:DPP IV N-terminal domain-containing protein [Chitinophagaceae bacterium]
KLLFDNDKLAALLTGIIKDPIDGQHLELDSLQFLENENMIRFQVKSSIDVIIKDTAAKKGAPPKKEKKIFYFEYNLVTGGITNLTEFKRTLRRAAWASVAPDSSIVLFGKNYNLYWMDFENYKKAQLNEKDSTIVEHAITTDGVENYSYHSRGFGETNVDEEKKKNDRRSVQVLWSPDVKNFVLNRTDQRKVKDLWVINSIAEPRPTLETYKYWMPGEKEAPIEEVLLFDVASKKARKLAVGLFKDQSVGIFRKPSLNKTRDDDFTPTLWLGNNHQFFLSRSSRDLKRIDICRVDVATTQLTVVIEERLNTYVEIRTPGLVNEGKEIIQWSERDGWAHFYLYDESGKLKNQITSGAFHCESIEGIDEKKRVLYFSANGREKEDPYYAHLYRINFDGTGLKLLNEGNFDHNFTLDDDKMFFVNNFSRVNTVPESALMDNNGKTILKLETADFTTLLTTGYKFPETFTVKADDGITDLFGVMYKPFDFDPNKKYPLIEYVYPGPQTESVNKSWGRGMDRIDRLAQLGFIVVTVGNRGGHPGRSKWYHNYGYGDLRDYGLADKKTAAEQLANRFSFIDINRVGIHGHSGGGFMSTAAILVYPDFFKAAVSNAGNHDNSIYNRWWSEKHHGVKEEIGEKGDTTFVYAIERNQDLAKNLKGRLLLMHGEIDNNVSPVNTIRVVNALIKANKRFEMLILPTQRHGFGDMTEYWFWKTADHFTRYLLNDRSDRSVDFEEINRDTNQSKQGKPN